MRGKTGKLFTSPFSVLYNKGIPDILRKTNGKENPYVRHEQSEKKKLFLFDIDGTIAVGNTLFDGSAELISYIKSIRAALPVLSPTTPPKAMMTM